VPSDEGPSGPPAPGRIRWPADGSLPAPRRPVRIPEVTAEPLVDVARRTAGRLLQEVEPRWAHTQGVARRAESVVGAVRPADRPILVAAAWLHDIGYAPGIRRTGFHPLDGALHLREQQWQPSIVGLVAHHSGARYVAEAWGLGGLLRSFDDVDDALADALTYADQTIGPDGEPMDVEDRLEDMLRRHGADSPNARAHARRAPAVRAAVRRTEQRLRAAAPDSGLRTGPVGDRAG
jgi:hypothetical protein